MPPQTVPARVWKSVDQRVRAVLEAYAETVALLNEAPRSRAGAPVAYGALALLLDALAAPLTEEATAHVLATSEVRFAQPQIWRALTRIEREAARFFSARHDSALLTFAPLIRSERALAEAEIALWDPPLDCLRSEPPGRLMLIGLGALPITAATIYAATGCPVLYLEPNPIDAALARAYVQETGLANGIRVQDAPVETVDYTAAAALLIGDSVPRKKALLQRALTQNPNLNIAVRSGTGVQTLLYEPLDQQVGPALFLSFARRTASVNDVFKTTYFSASPAERQTFEKEEPKPDLADVKYFPRDALHAHA
jgi:hypothetical protein